MPSFTLSGTGDYVLHIREALRSGAVRSVFITILAAIE